MAPWRPLCHPVAGAYQGTKQRAKGCFRVFAEDNPILGAVSGCGQAKRIRALDQGIKSGDLPDAIRVFASVELKFETDPFFVDPSSPSEAPASQKAISWPAPVTTARQKARHKFWTQRDATCCVTEEDGAPFPCKLFTVRKKLTTIQLTTCYVADIKKATHVFYQQETLVLSVCIPKLESSSTCLHYQLGKVFLFDTDASHEQ